MTTPAQPVSGSGAYIALPVTVDPDTLATDALTYLAQQQPGYVARPGNLETWLVQAMARMCAETAQVAAQVPLAVFQYFGTQLLNLPPLQGSSATLTATINVVDAAGYLIPAGTTVAYPLSSTTNMLFRTTADFSIAAGATSSGLGSVTFTAVTPGTAANDLPPTTLSMVDALSFVTSIVSTSISSGGADPETQQTYLNRLAAELQLLSPRPILPADFAALARNQAGVARAIALDGYNPSSGSFGNERMVAVAVIDSGGLALEGSAAAAVATALQNAREVNFVVNVVDPAYSTVNVAAQVVLEPGAAAATVLPACQAALTALLSPAHWGDSLVDGAWLGQWINTPTVRYLSVGAAVAAVPGVAYVSGLQMSLGSGSYAAGDLGLPGAIPLAVAGAVNVTLAAS